MLARLTTLAICVTLLGAVEARAGAPFGGDDGGFVPPDGDVKRCEERVLSKAMGKGKLMTCLMKCHVRGAQNALKGTPFDDTACEAACRASYDAVGYPGACPPCLDAAARGAIADEIEAYVDDAVGDLYCDGTTPFGDDDPGFVPPDAATERCERKVAQNILKYVVGCVRLCHFKAARHAVRGEPFDEEACEGSCLAKFQGNRDKLVQKGLCSGCLDAAGQDAIAADAESFADDLNGDIYCASPGGAFLD